LQSSVQAATGDLRVAFNTLPPWKILDDNGHPSGIDIEFLYLLAERMHLTVKFIHLPFKRGLKMLEHGDVDLMVGVLRRPERETFAHFLTPAYKNKTHKAFYVLTGRENILKEYNDMHHLKIGTQLGGKYFPRFDADKEIEKVVVKTTELNIKMLLAKRIDAFITTEAAGDYRLAQSGMTNTISKARYIYHKQQDVFMILSKRSPHTRRLAEFNSVMRDLVESGEFENISNNFFSTQAP
jgi:polar amino acid transport system substrate-binding protein